MLARKRHEIYNSGINQGSSRYGRNAYFEPVEVVWLQVGAEGLQVGVPRRRLPAMRLSLQAMRTGLTGTHGMRAYLQTHSGQQLGNERSDKCSASCC